MSDAPIKRTLFFDPQRGAPFWFSDDPTNTAALRLEQMQTLKVQKYVDTKIAHRTAEGFQDLTAEQIAQLQAGMHKGWVFRTRYRVSEDLQLFLECSSARMIDEEMIRDLIYGIPGLRDDKLKAVRNAEALIDTFCVPQQSEQAFRERCGQLGAQLFDAKDRLTQLPSLFEQFKGLRARIGELNTIASQIEQEVRSGVHTGLERLSVDGQTIEQLHRQAVNLAGYVRGEAARMRKSGEVSLEGAAAAAEQQVEQELQMVTSLGQEHAAIRQTAARLSQDGWVQKLQDPDATAAVTWKNGFRPIRQMLEAAGIDASIRDVCLVGYTPDGYLVEVGPQGFRVYPPGVQPADGQPAQTPVAPPSMPVVDDRGGRGGLF